MGTKHGLLGTLPVRVLASVVLVDVLAIGGALMSHWLLGDVALRPEVAARPPVAIQALAPSMGSVRPAPEVAVAESVPAPTYVVVREKPLPMLKAKPAASSTGEVAVPPEKAATAKPAKSGAGANWDAVNAELDRRLAESGGN